MCHKEVGTLFGKKVRNIPSRQAVYLFVDRKLALTHKHEAKVDAPSSTLYTDETRKHGHTYETNIISDERQNFYMLGLRGMINKRGSSTADTFKEMLQDISKHCDYREELGHKR
ncbi:hypothetical protein DPMN_125311 [Dreissena polymorpha]|uniref:Transposase n=1 Tax=Dreissena polymorpha TaxID=45954 RepID=A0A9D4JTE2_DREPO|nr:hypothetical protein DPMN_125311 [Dreissena polymorpha]